MYKIKLSNTIIHDEREVFVERPILERKLNKAGALTFTITKYNPGYYQVLPRTAPVYVYKRGGTSEEVLWSGVVLSYRINMYGEKEVTCEGTLALLNDVSSSVDPSGEYPCSLERYLQRYLFTSHNTAINGSGSGRLAVRFGEQDFVGKMHLYAVYAQTTNSEGYIINLYCEMLSSTGLTAAQLSNVTVCLPDKARGLLYIAYEPGSTGKTAQKIKIENAYMTDHVVSSYYTGKSLTADGSYEYLTPNSEVEISKINPDCYQLLYGGGDKRIISFDVEAPTIGKTTMLTKAFKDAYCSTMEKVNKVLDRFGGYVKAYAEDRKGMRVAYKEGFTKSCGQKITLGDNLEDYMEDVNVDIYNKITPLGRNKGTSFLWDYVTIENVNGGCPYVVDDESSRLYGQIEKVVHYDDVDDPAELMKLAKIELNNSINYELSLSVKAADKSMVDVDVQAFDVGLLTEITIPPLNITRNLVCTSIKNHLSEPEKDEYTFGCIPKTSSSYVASGSSVSANGNSGSDVEVVQANGGYCLKFPNGWAIATIWKSVSFTTPTAWGNLWYGDCGKPLGALPITFKNIIYRNITIDDGGSYWLLWYPGNESNWSGTIFPIGATKQTSTQRLIFRGVCIGTWK